MPERLECEVPYYKRAPYKYTYLLPYLKTRYTLESEVYVLFSTRFLTAYNTHYLA